MYSRKQPLPTISCRVWSTLYYWSTRQKKVDMRKEQNVDGNAVKNKRTTKILVLYDIFFSVSCSPSKSMS